MFSWLAQRIQAILRIVRNWFSRHAFGLPWLAQRIQAILRIVRNRLSRHAFGLTIALLIVAFVVVFFWHRIVISIYPGEAGVLWRRFGGTVVDTVYGEGLHLVFPINIMYIYNVRWQVVERSVTELTREGLDMTADVAVLYRINYPKTAELHRDVGPKYVETLIVPTLESAVRTILGRLDVDLLYVDRPATVYQTDVGTVDLLEHDLLERAKEDVGWKYIEVADINVRRLLIPERIQEAIQRRREAQQLALEYDFHIEQARKEAVRKRIEAEGVRDFQNTITGGLTSGYLTFKSIEAILELAKSPNAKVIVFGEKGAFPLFGNVPLTPTDQIPPE